MAKPDIDAELLDKGEEESDLEAVDDADTEGV